MVPGSPTSSGPMGPRRGTADRFFRSASPVRGAETRRRRGRARAGAVTGSAGGWPSRAGARAFTTYVFDHPSLRLERNVWPRAGPRVASVVLVQDFEVVVRGRAVGPLGHLLGQRLRLGEVRVLHSRLVGREFDDHHVMVRVVPGETKLDPVGGALVLGVLVVLLTQAFDFRP